MNRRPFTHAIVYDCREVTNNTRNDVYIHKLQVLRSSSDRPGAKSPPATTNILPTHNDFHVETQSPKEKARDQNSNDSQT
jgi:hypothetical protein